MWGDSVLIQTITEDSVFQDEHYLFEGILSCHDQLLVVQDVNFDNSEDFGIYCGATYNGPMYWFLWDEGGRKYQPGFFSSIDLTVDVEKKQLVDTWKDGNVGYDCYMYQFNSQGKRVQIDHRRVDYPVPYPGY